MKDQGHYIQYNMAHLISEGIDICRLFAFQPCSTVIPAINLIFLEIVILSNNNFSFF